MLRYCVKPMGRPREHDESTAAALLAAAERMVHESGPDGLSVRGVASEVGTTTRAVYSLYGSKEGLPSALAVRAFELLGAGIEALPATDDPAADLVAAGLMFRRFATDHPSLFAIGIQRAAGEIGRVPAILHAALASMALLQQRIARLDLGGRTVEDAAMQFHGLCEGLASMELRGSPPTDHWDRLWREGLTALVAGLAV